MLNKESLRFSIFLKRPKLKFKLKSFISKYFFYRDIPFSNEAGI